MQGNVLFVPNVQIFFALWSRNVVFQQIFTKPQKMGIFYHFIAFGFFLLAPLPPRL